MKFYSSSLVLKSAAGTVAVDFCQGPINGGGRKAFDQRRAMTLFRGEGFHLTREALDAGVTNSTDAAKEAPT